MILKPRLPCRKERSAAVHPGASCPRVAPTIASRCGRPREPLTYDYAEAGFSFGNLLGVVLAQGWEA